MSDAHLHNAARALERALTAQFPERSWIVEVREPDRPNTEGLPAAAGQVDQARAVTNDTDALAERRTRTAAAAATHHHDLKKSA